VKGIGIGFSGWPELICSVILLSIYSVVLVLILEKISRFGFVLVFIMSFQF